MTITAYNCTAPSTPVSRALWIDRMRAALTVLVIFHHAAITYGASGSWFYKSVSDTDPVLTLIAAIDQSFFMGAFFLIAGYLAPFSLARKGTIDFLIDRLLRLGLPSLAFGAFLGPVTTALAIAIPTSLSAMTSAIWDGPFILGPMWFPMALLLFSAGFAVVAPLGGGRRVPPLHHWILVALATGLTALLLRQIFPIGTSTLGFQVGYFAGYLACFGIGVAASRHCWLDRLPLAAIRKSRRVGLAVLPLLPIVLVTSGDHTFETGFSPAAITYALWEPLMALAIIPSLILWGQRRSALPRAVWHWAADNSYAAFIVHAPILVASCRAADAISLPPLLALTLSTLLGTCAAFSCGALLRTSELLRRIL